MREYQLRSMNAYVLPKEVYHQCLWVVRDVERLQALALHAADRSLPQCSAARARLEAIYAAMNKIPEEYRQGIFDQIVNREPFKNGAHENTWKKWKQRFLYELAINLMIV